MYDIMADIMAITMEVSGISAARGVVLKSR
jgi:hypothetical protein